MNDFVTYEAFGAVGDGVTDDAAAIAAAHAYANEHHLPVKFVCVRMTAGVAPPPI